MKAMIIDLTHGGIIISKYLKKLGYEVWAYDIYNTIKEKDKKELENKDIKLIRDLDEINKVISDSETYIISPVHCPLNIGENMENIKLLNFHEALSLILKNWNNKRKKEDKVLIEITGVKGKTSTLNLLKDILIKEDNLVSLSSLGLYYYKQEKENLLEKNISINPTSLIKLVETCKSKNINDYKYILVESSLGTSSLSDISILTNIIEDYSIAKNKKKSSEAKKQVFNSKLIIGEYETLLKFYPSELETLKNKINTFSLKNNDANLRIEEIKQSMGNTYLNIKYDNLKTLDGEFISGNIELNTFAPGDYNVSNILASITAALSLGKDKKSIIALNDYNQINGRTSKRMIDDCVIIEEINPGLNVKSIEKSINMVKNLENYSVILGGEYGVTCEEIDEKKLSKYLENEINNGFEIILVDELGESIKNKINHKIEYYENYNNAINKLIEDNKNILFIYRSNYSNLNKR